MSKETEQAKMQWLHYWGVGHEYPQLVMADIVPVRQEEQQEIVEYYQYLHLAVL